DARHHRRDVCVRRAALDRQGVAPRPRLRVQGLKETIMTAALALSESFPPISAPHGTLARLVGIGKTYGTGEHAVTALSNATLDIRPGEVTLIEGPSGSGKTTLISILGLLLTPTTGEVWLEGQNVAGLGERALPGLRAR